MFAKLIDWLGTLRHPRGTFVFDPYRGWTRSLLKQRCRELARVVDDYQFMVMEMAEAPGSLDKLDPEDRARVERLILAYKD